jgi:hypothetical protein
VAAFAARLKDAVDLDSVRADLASMVTKALEPAHVSVWISHRDGGWLPSTPPPPSGFSPAQAAVRDQDHEVRL